MAPTTKKNPSPPPRPDVFRYHDHREFLRDWVRYLAKSGTGVSLRKIAAAAGLSIAYLPLVLAGKRRLSPRALEKILPHLALQPEEKHQLTLLVQLGEASSSRRRHEAVEALQLVSRYRQTNPTEADVFEYLSHWHYVVIREMVNLPHFRLDARWIQSQLPPSVTLPEVRRALRFLLEKGFVEELPEGRARNRERNLDCTGQVFGSALRKFHHAILPATLRSLDETPKEEHWILGHTMAFPKQAFPELQAILNDTIARVRELEARCKETDAVYHVTVLATPLADTSAPNSKKRKPS